jgi:hypothetical protein
MICPTITPTTAMLRRIAPAGGLALPVTGVGRGPSAKLADL